MWREYYQYFWKQSENGNIILLSLQDPSKIIVFPLIGEDFQSYITDLDKIKTGLNLPIEIVRVPESVIEKLKNIIPQLEIYEDRDNWDYVYKRSDLLELPGKKYASIRHKLNKFNREYPISIEPLTSDNAKLCLQLQEEWCNLRACSDTPSLDNEDKAIRDILLHIGQLRFHRIRCFT